MNVSVKSQLQLESLEQRLTPAFDVFFNPASDTWTVTQVQDDGNAVIRVDAVTNDLVIDDGAGGPVTVGVANGGLDIRMMDNSSGDVSVALDSPLFGDVNIDIGHSNRILQLNGSSNTILGNLTISAGNGNQLVDLADVSDLSVGGNLTVDMGQSSNATFADFLGMDENVSVAGNFTMRNVKTWDGVNDLTVGGNLSMVAHGTNVDNLFNRITNTGNTIVGGNFTYVGGNGRDVVNLNDTLTIIGGSVNISLGNNINTGDQTVNMSGALIGGNVTVRGGTIDTNDVITSSATTVIGGNFYANTGTLGNDSVTLLGTIGGRSVTVITGLGDDGVVYGMTGNNVRVFASLSLGDDSFTLNAGSDLGYLYVDFGFGSDVYTTLFGAPYPFRVYLRNLP